jgi:hypothetical protein
MARSMSRHPRAPVTGERADRFPASLGYGYVAPEELDRASSEFLLEREPATSILRRFSLDVISGYFPGYPSKMSGRLGGGDPGTSP